MARLPDARRPRAAPGHAGAERGHRRRLTPHRRTLLSALAASTSRLRLGLLVTSNRIRPPADLAKITTTEAVEGLLGRSRLLDRYCAEVGRDPVSSTRSVHLPLSYDDSGATRDAVAAAVGAGFRHVVLGLGAPYPEGVAQWVADEIVAPFR